MKRWTRYILITIAACICACVLSGLVAATFFRTISIQSVLIEPVNTNLALPSELFSGPTDARVSIVDVFDLEDPNTAIAQPSFDSLLLFAKSSLQILCVPYPRKNFVRKKIYGKAIFAAQRQGKQLDMKHALLLQKPWRPENQTGSGAVLAMLFKAADACTLDLDRFESDLFSDDIDSLYRKAHAAVAHAGIMAIPTLFINGFRIEGALNFKTYCQAFEKIPASDHFSENEGPRQ